MVAIGGVNSQSYNNFAIDSNVANEAPVTVKNETPVKETGAFDDVSFNDGFHDGSITYKMGSSTKVDGSYFKTTDGLKTPGAIEKGNISGYDVSVDGSSTRVTTEGGRDFNEYVAGRTVMQGVVSPAIHGGILVPEFSLGLGFDNQGFGFATSLDNWMLDVRHNYDTDGQGLLSSHMGDLGGSTLVGLRRMFTNDFGSGSIGLVTGNVGNLSDAGHGVFLAVGGHADVHLWGKTFLDNNLRISADAANDLSLPIIYGNNSTNVSNNAVATSLLSGNVEYDFNQFTFGAGFNANLDLARALHSIDSSTGFSIPTTSFAQASVNYDGGMWNAAANVYIPVTNHDNSFADQATWNVQGAYSFKDTGIKMTGSLTGNFDSSPVSKVGIGATNGVIDLGLNLSGIDTGNTSLGFSVKVDLTNALWGSFLF